MVAVVAVLGLIYFLKLVLDHDPARAARSLIAVLLMLTLIGGLSYFFFNRVVDFANDLPNYSSKIRETASKVCSQTSKIEERTRSAVTPPQKKQAKVVPVRIQEHPGVSSLLPEGGSTLMEVLLAISFVPFLVFFMLTWKGHAHFATVRLFPKGGTAF